MKINNIKIMGVFATVLLLVIVLTASFAYFGSFNINLNNNVAVNVNSVSPGDATFTSNATQLNLQVPAANMSQTVANNTIAAASNTATLTVNLTGASNLLTTCTYDIVYEYDSNSYIYGGTGTNHVTKNSDKEITLQVTGVTGTNNFASEKNFDYDSNWSGLKRTLVSGATISSNGTLTTQNISITGKYYNLTLSQSSLEGKNFTGKIYVTNHKCEISENVEYGYMTILNNNGGKAAIEAKEKPNFNEIATTNEGMYAAEDDLGTSYYFRGAVNNNWVKFGKTTQDLYYCEIEDTLSEINIEDNCALFILKNSELYWRIIRINGDGSIRMIYSGMTNPSTESSVTGSKGVFMTGEGTQIGISPFNSNSDNNLEYVGFMYTDGEQHGNNISSHIKSQMDIWYNSTTLKGNNLVSQDQVFCNDRSLISGSWSTLKNFNYSPFTRLFTTNNSQPILTCPILNDKFTVNPISGNGALTYPAGLITADELVMAGGKITTHNKLYYLYTNQDYFLGSPSYYEKDMLSSFMFIIDEYGALRTNSPDAYLGIRPVISLSPKAKLFGSGTYNDVYTVS